MICNSASEMSRCGRMDVSTYERQTEREREREKRRERETERKGRKCSVIRETEFDTRGEII